MFQRSGRCWSRRRCRRRRGGRGRSYCFELVAGATLGADSTVQGTSARRSVGNQSVGVGAGDVDGAGAGAGVAFVAARVADEASHGVDGRQVALEPALHPLLLVLDGVPGEEDEEEAEELEAGGEAEVDEAQGGDVVFPAGAVDAAVLLPQHAGGVDDGAEVNGCRDVG